jgi:hypothetical protein
VEVRVRMGLHTGEPAVGTEGYLGLDVVRAARLCTAGGGGHVLLSEATRALVGGSLPDGVSLFPLGERQLKDLDEPERIFELEIEGVTPPSEAEERSPVPPPAPAAPAPPGAPDADWGDRLAQRIDALVKSKVEAGLSRALGNVDQLAERAAQDPERIADRLDDET